LDPLTLEFWLVVLFFDSSLSCLSFVCFDDGGLDELVMTTLVEVFVVPFVVVVVDELETLVSVPKFSLLFDDEVFKPFLFA
jgi:hypothetical protein